MIYSFCNSSDIGGARNCTAAKWWRRWEQRDRRMGVTYWLSSNLCLRGQRVYLVLNLISTRFNEKRNALGIEMSPFCVSCSGILLTTREKNLSAWIHLTYDSHSIVAMHHQFVRLALSLASHDNWEIASTCNCVVALLPQCQIAFTVTRWY